MRIVRGFAHLATLALCVAFIPQASAQSGSAEDVVADLYALVTFEPGEVADWDAVRALFLPQATVVLRTGPEEMSVFSLEGFVDDFVSFIERANVIETGFTERILCMRSMTFGDIAHVGVLFDSHIPGSGRPPNPGIDFFDLIRLDGEWRIVSVINDRPAPGRPLPAGLDQEC
jgi:hypothetical protein